MFMLNGKPFLAVSKIADLLLFKQLKSKRKPLLTDEVTRIEFEVTVCNFAQSLIIVRFLCAAKSVYMPIKLTVANSDCVMFIVEITFALAFEISVSYNAAINDNYTKKLDSKF